MAYNFTERFFEEERIKLSNQLTEKIQAVEKEREQEKSQVNEAIKTGYISALASEFKIAKPEYTRFFKGADAIQIENGKIINSDNVVKSFLEFRNTNKELFNLTADEIKPIPKTDTFFCRSQVDIPAERTQEEKLIESVKREMQKPAYQNLATTKL